MLDLQSVTRAERKRLVTAGFGKRVGFGQHPAVVVIDVQNYNVGPKEGPDSTHPSGVGPAAYAAVSRIYRLLAAARKKGVPVIYTQFVLRRDGVDIGVYGRKRTFLNIEDWCLEGTEGAEIHQSVKPKADDIVLIKKRPSAFFGTLLNSILIDRRVDTLIITGGTTSNCVRATAVDSMSYNYRTIVVRDCVYDRVRISHEIALFDLDRQYADVIESEAVLKYFGSLGRQA